MAGDWIKFEKATFDKPEVIAMASALEISQEQVVGCLLRVWSWFDDHTENGDAPSVTRVTLARHLDRLVDISGFTETMLSTGWLKLSTGENESLSMPHFDRHNGKSAKTRALTSSRNREYRSKMRDAVDDASVTQAASPREEKRRITPQTPQGARRANRAKGENNRNGAALAQVKNAKGPEQLSAVLRRLGLGDGPAGKSWQETQAWAVKQCEQRVPSPINADG